VFLLNEKQFFTIGEKVARVFIEILVQFLMKLLEDYSGLFQVFLDVFVQRRGNALAANEEHTEVLGNHVE
jgi:hypothetical protein